MSPNPSHSPVKGDGLIYKLEVFQNWVTDHWKFIVAFFVVLFVAAFGAQALRQNGLEKQLGYWEMAAKAKTPDEKEAFIKNNADASAAQILALQLAREELDSGEFAKAEAMTDLFLQRNAEHPHRALALLLRGYAREELGKKSEALADVEKAAEDKAYEFLAKTALERLK